MVKHLPNFGPYVKVLCILRTPWWTFVLLHRRNGAGNRLMTRLSALPLINGRPVVHVLPGANVTLCKFCHLDGVTGVLNLYSADLTLGQCLCTVVDSFAGALYRFIRSPAFEKFSLVGPVLLWG